MRISNKGWEAVRVGALEMFFFRHFMKGTWSTIKFGDDEVKEHWREAYVDFLEGLKNDLNRYDALLADYNEKELEEKKINNSMSF